MGAGGQCALSPPSAADCCCLPACLPPAPLPPGPACTAAAACAPCCMLLLGCACLPPTHPPTVLHPSPGPPLPERRYAVSNTRRGIETCGILAGTLSPDDALFTITTLIVPKQQGTTDTVRQGGGAGGSVGAVYCVLAGIPPDLGLSPALPSLPHALLSLPWPPLTALPVLLPSTQCAG